MHLAARHENVAALRALVDSGERMDIDALDKYACRPLHDAAERNNRTVLRILIGAKAKR